MDLTRSVTPAPAVTPEPPTSSQAPASAGSNQALLASLGLAGGAAALPVDSLAALLPTLGPVGAVVLDALPVPTAVQLALTMSTVPWVSDWLGEADELSGRSATAAVGSQLGAGATNAGTGAGGQGGEAASGLAAALVPQAQVPTMPGPFKNAPATQAEALARHVADEAKVAAVMASARSIVVDPEAGESRPALLKNSVEWIDDGLAELRVLSLTHDGHLRPEGNAGKLAWFDERARFGAPATYDASVDASGTPTNDAGIEMQFAGVVGTMGNDGVLTLYGPTLFPESLLVETLIHEVQHDADQTGGAWSRGQGAPTCTDTAASSGYFEAYRSEFNAYWLEQPEGSQADDFAPAKDPAANVAVSAKTPNGVQTVATDFDNARQASIFAHLVGATPPGADWGSPSTDWTRTYSYVPYFYVVDPAFKSTVDALNAVTSGNQVNSPRIQALWDAFASHDPGAVAVAVTELEALDRETLGSGDTAGDFWRFAKKEMPAEAADLRTQLRPETSAQDVTDTCDGPAEETTPGTVVVQPGDTLLSLSDRYLGDPNRVAELADLNGLVFGTSSEQLTPGQRLRIPPQ